MAVFKVTVNNRDYRVTKNSTIEAIKDALDQYLGDIYLEPQNCDVDLEEGISIQATLFASSPIIEPPVLDTAVDAGGQLVNLTWTNDASITATDHIIRWSTTSGGVYDNELTTGDATASYSELDVTSAGTYYFVVQTTTADGTSALSNELSVVVA